ncbi:MAG: hypothetical protein ABI877_01010 [Gemmatimonadaceae bacterium]
MEPSPDADETEIVEIIRGFLAVQSRSAAEENRPLRRGTHAKGVCANAVFEVLDVSKGRDPALASRLAKGIYATACSYPATVRFANSDPQVNTDWEPDVRGLSFAVDLAPSGTAGDARIGRQDYSLQSAPTHPFNDVHAFLVFAKVSGAPSEAIGLGSLPFRDQAVFSETSRAVMQQKRQPVRPYQQLRYWSNVPFRHGSLDVVKYSVVPAANPACALEKRNPNALRDELIRHVSMDATMSSFDFGLQFLNTEDMTYQGKRRDSTFWIENASIEWPEEQAPFHTVARLTILPQSILSDQAAENMYIDVMENSTTESAPLGRVNRARWYAEGASRKARRGRRT